MSSGRFPRGWHGLRLHSWPQSTEPRVAKPNYRFQKQQRELKKSKQQEEKLRKKQMRSDAAKPAATPQEESK